MKTQKARVKELALTLSETRKKAAQLFVADLQPLAQTLGMRNLAFDIKFTATD